MGFKDRMNSYDDYKFRTNGLNEKTVQVFFERCLVTENTAESDILPCYLFRKENGFEENSDPVYLDKQALRKMDKNIRYILGQTMAVHNGLSRIISIQELLIKYTGTPWTTNTGIFTELLILGYLNGCVNEIRKTDDSISTILGPVLKPTLSPDDPNFEAWWEDHKAKWED